MKQFLLSIAIMLFGVLYSDAQKVVSGVVTDDAGVPLIGANVLAKEAAAIGTITDVDGSYKLQIPENVTTLVFSYAGYSTKEMEIGTASVMNVTLAEGKVLEEIVVVGYGAQKKKDVTGSISSFIWHTAINCY